MSYIRKNAGRIIRALLVLVLIESVALLSVLLELDKKTAPVQTPAVQTGAETVPVRLPEDPVETEPEPEPEPEPGPETITKPEPIGPSAADILLNTKIISHGMGKIDGVTTLNCLESFQRQYAQGVRVFEADLRLTADLQVVLRHDWRAGWQDGVSETSIPTLAEFKDKPLLGEYTPLSFRDLLQLMEKYPDICVITDTKFTDAEIVTIQFEAMLRDAQELGAMHLFDRIVVQVYSELMFKVVDSVGDFPHYIYTLYNTGFNSTEEAFTDVAAFCKENGIAGVTMWDHWWRNEFSPIAKDYGLKVYVHTVNDIDAALRLTAGGVGAIYTDEITPGDMEIPKGMGESRTEDRFTVLPEEEGEQTWNT